mgnify:CR=1 FL=1
MNIEKTFKKNGLLLTGALLVIIGVGGLTRTAGIDIGSVWVGAVLAIVGAFAMWIGSKKK